MDRYDLVIRGGTVFDGTNRPGRELDVAIRGRRVVHIAENISQSGSQEIQAQGHWVMPGFIDFHTHYDAEIEIDPSLSESVRHGVTSIVMGSCSLSTAVGEPADIADIFCRVEGIPRRTMLPLLEDIKDWTTFPEYFEHLDTLPKGPHVSAFVGHSNLRMDIMGFERSLDKSIRPNQTELETMKRTLSEALDAGYLGLSVQTLPWDKLDGDRFRSRPLPSYFAHWSEYRALTRILRDRERIFQGVPNVVTKVNVLLFLLESMGIFRKPLKTTVISLMDVISNRSIVKIVPLLSRLFNRWLGADFRFQALPNLFDVWADGMDLVIFEEFATGTEAIHLADLGQRSELLRNADYRRRFKTQWGALFSPRIFHRDFQKTKVLACPDNSLVGLSFLEIARTRHVHPVDAFLDLAAEYGERLRWYSAVANDRQGPLEFITAHPDVLIGFSDAGAHLRNMAHYAFPLRMLKLVRDAHLRGTPFMTIERAVHRLTGEIAEWFGLSNGRLEKDQIADIVVVKPESLDDRLDQIHEEEMPGFDGLHRLVRRSGDAVSTVIINGRIAARNGCPVPELGRSHGFGTLLRATH